MHGVCLNVLEVGIWDLYSECMMLRITIEL